MNTTDVARAIAAATSIAASLGLRADDAAVLHNSNKLALRLTPCDAFARVAPEGQEVAQFEVELAQRLTEVGSPVGRLEPRADPRVYRRDGFAVTLWTYYEPVTPPTSSADYASALEQLLHREPHPGNVLSTRYGPLFIDLETCCRGPVEFDLAHAPVTVGGHYPGVDHGLLDDCRQLVIAMIATWRWEVGDQFPDGRRFGEECLRLLRAGPPWPALDALPTQPDGP